jgi:transcriptional regulator with XRE-family HTH domain
MKKPPSQADIEIGERIKQIRAEKGWSGVDLAKRLGVTRGAVGNWELGKGIKRQNLQRIADIARISFDWLATGRGAPGDRKDSIDRLLEDLPSEYADDLHDEFERQVIRTKKLIEANQPPKSR